MTSYIVRYQHYHDPFESHESEVVDWLKYNTDNGYIKESNWDMTINSNLEAIYSRILRVRFMNKDDAIIFKLRWV